MWAAAITAKKSPPPSDHPSAATAAPTPFLKVVAPKYKAVYEQMNLYQRDVTELKRKSSRGKQEVEMKHSGGREREKTRTESRICDKDRKRVGEGEKGSSERETEKENTR